jgi:hypothetical protein
VNTNITNFMPLMIEAAEIWRQKNKEEELRKAELDRRRQLEALAARESQVWEEVESLIEEKNASAYDKAVGLLKDLRDLGRYQGDTAKFRNRLDEINRTYPNRPALRRRIREANLS